MSTVDSLWSKDHFDSAAEHLAFERALERELGSGTIVEIPVGLPDPLRKAERWFREASSGAIYRYVPPDFPARGVWEPVS